VEDLKIEIDYTNPQIEIANSADLNKYIVITKGRRFGLTHGIALFFIECMLEGEALMWGDTINSNIDRYVERYFIPCLKKNNLEYTWNAQKKVLSLVATGGYTDFRSADKPENWEGFGYNKIFLNEAGIILKNDYLYTNAVLPMLIDYPNSTLIAGGVPKGKLNKKGKEHRFYSIYKKAKAKTKGYKLFEYSSYDNPLLKASDIEELEAEISSMNHEMVQQEIYGHFVEGASGLLWEATHINASYVEHYPRLKRVVVAIDPAASAKIKSDDTGIIAVGIDSNNNCYVLEDMSGKYTPEEWGSQAKQLKSRWNASAYVIEKNQGGDMAKNVIKQVDKNTRVIMVHASKGKYARAEPVFALYEQGKVFHYGHHVGLENEMLNFNPDLFSPNRVDALVWGVYELALKVTQKKTKVTRTRIKQVR